MNDARGPDHLKKISSKIEKILNLKSENNDISIQLEEFLNSINIFINLNDDIGLNFQQREKLSTMVNVQRMLNNPISFHKEQIDYIFNL